MIHTIRHKILRPFRWCRLMAKMRGVCSDEFNAWLRDCVAVFAGALLGYWVIVQIYDYSGLGG